MNEWMDGLLQCMYVCVCRLDRQQAVQLHGMLISRSHAHLLICVHARLDIDGADRCEIPFLIAAGRDLYEYVHTPYTYVRMLLADSNVPARWK